MKKGTIIALIVAAVLILAGGILLVLGLSFAGTSAPKSTLIQNEVLVQEPFENIRIDTADCDVTFVPYNGTADAQVVLREREEISHRVAVENGTLVIEMVDNRTWKDFIGVKWENMEMTVYVPETEYASLRVATATGDIHIPEALSGKEMHLHSDTGDIDCSGAVSDLLNIMTDTGEVWVRGCTPELMQLESDTGDIELEAIPRGGEFHIKNGTGSAELTDVKCRILTVETNTGDQELERVVTEEYLQNYSNTGDISIEDSDAAQVNIETNTGDVEGHFLTSKWFQAHSDTGNVKVPNTREGGECRIESDTGDIHFN